MTAQKVSRITGRLKRPGLPWVTITSRIVSIFHGGAYRDGVDREDLTALFRALEAKMAVELDGGGSAALVIKNGIAKWGGGEAPKSSCPNSGAWCSPIKQPDGNARPVPSWLGIELSRP